MSNKEVYAALDAVTRERDEWRTVATEHQTRLNATLAERDALKAELARLADAHPHCAAFDDQPGPCDCKGLRAQVERMRLKLATALAYEGPFRAHRERDALKARLASTERLALVASSEVLDLRAQVERLTALLDDADEKCLTYIDTNDGGCCSDTAEAIRRTLKETTP